MKKNKAKAVTIHDLAEELKVSASTVSRALNEQEGIGKKTRKAVKKLAKEWGYRPNRMASSLRTNTSRTIGILVPWINRPFISSLISGIENAARGSGYQVIIAQSHDSSDQEKENIQTLYDTRISALIISLAMETTDYSHFELIQENDIPVVFVDRIPNLGNCIKVQINNFKAAFDATAHLIAQGCTRIAHFGGSSNQIIYQDRRLGYLSALKNAGLDIDERLNLQAQHLSAEEGTRLSEQIFSLENPPDGIFCANDTSAISAIKYAQEKNIRIPEDLAIIGFNDDPICTVISPQLSSITHPASSMGMEAVNQVISLLNGKSQAHDSAVSLSLETNLVIRASSDRRR